MSPGQWLAAVYGFVLVVFLVGLWRTLRERHQRRWRR